MNGKIQVEVVSSVVLKDNPLGDPRRREIPVYLPPSLAGGVAKRRYPVLYYLPGFTGGGLGAVNRKLWQENIVERFDRLIAEKKAKEAILVIPDCVTAYGGSQYVNSPATGRYEDHIVAELIPFIDDKFPTVRAREGRALIGKSSGGFGALHLAMRNSQHVAHVASHSGDMLFELGYAPDFAKFVNNVDKIGEGSFEKWLSAFRASRDKDGFSHEAINTVAMASCYSPNPKSKWGFDLPCDLRTGEVLPRVFARWKAFDPVEACSFYKGSLKSLKTLFFDAGRRDEFFLHLGARKLSDRLKALKVPHIHEEHDRGHFDMAHRYDRSLALLTSRLKSA
jgi:enterochelin esterase family protein